MSIPKDKLDQIFSDPEFLKLEDSEKESLLSALDSTFKTEVKPEKKVAGLYEKDVLASKFIPQFTKGLEEGTPLGRRVIMGDIPRQVSEGMPQPQGFMGTAGRVMGKYAAPVAMSIGAGGLAEQAAGKFIPGLAGASLAPRVGRVAIGSAVGAQPFEYKGPAERLTATGVAAVAGPVIGETIGLGIKGIKAIPGMASKVKEAFSAGKKLKSVADEMGNVENQLEKLRRIDLPEAEATLTAKAVEKAEKNKVILDKMGDKLTSTYGKAQDTIESRITAKATQDDVVGIIDEALNDLDTPALQNTSVYKTLNGLKSKYSPEEGVIQLDPKKFTLSELKNFKNSVLGKFTPGRSEENLAKAIFRSKYGKFLEQYAPEMLELNSEFSGHINSFKQASKLFQTTDEKLVAKGAKALEAIAKSNPTNPSYIDNLNILKSLEKSSGRFSGAGKGSLTGDFTKQIDRIRGIDTQIQSLTKKKYLLQNETSRLKELRSLRNQVLTSIGGSLGIGTATAIGVKLAN